MKVKPPNYGFPKIPSGNGIQISSATYDISDDWYSINAVHAIEFNNTTSNTSRLSDIFHVLEQKLN